MPQIHEPLYWDEDDNNSDHIWDSHKVDTWEIEEVLFEENDREPPYVAFWKGGYYVVLGVTNGGRLLKIAGEFIDVEAADGAVTQQFRPVHASPMGKNDKQRFEGKLK